MRKSIVMSLLAVFGGTVSLSAQGLGDLLKKVTSTVSKENGNGILSSLLGGKVTQDKIVGNWVYSGPAVVYESENILNSAGGKLVSSKIESQLSETLEKIGINEGVLKLTLNKDNTYKSSIKDKTTEGIYELSDSTITFYTSKKTKLLTTYVSATSGALQLSFKADKLLSFVSMIGSSVKSSAALNTVSSLLSSYDGLQLGLRYKKE